MTAKMREKVVKSARSLLPQVTGNFEEILPFHPNVLFLRRRLGASGITYFIALVAPPEREEFALEIGWSRDGKYPADVRIKNPRDASGFKPESLTGVAYRLRADRLWGMRRDHWWTVTQSLSADEMVDRLEAMASELQSPSETAADFEKRLSKQLDAAAKTGPEDVEVTVNRLVTEVCDRVVTFVLPYIDAVEAANS